MKKLVMITVLVAFGISICGCQQITRETHVKTVTQEIVSEEIVIE
jgi:hypothetical protein